MLGFLEGATENAEICEDFFADMERRVPKLSKKYLDDPLRRLTKSFMERIFCIFIREWLEK